MTDEDYMSDVELVHDPVRPVRHTVYGEGVFVDAWKDVLKRRVKHGDGWPNEKFISIISELPGPLEADDACKAASFMCWLGTNCGQSYLHQAKMLREALKEVPDRFARGNAYLHMWASQNVRAYAVNGGTRTMDAIIDRATIRDAELFEILARWLGTPEGQDFIVAAEDEREKVAKLISERRRADARVRARAAQYEQSGGL